MSQIMTKPLVIFGSSRTAGETYNAVKLITQDHEIDFVNLSDLKISYYDYEHKNKDDDFIPLAEKMAAASVIILATPVYWYSMSAIMKTFIDRWSDLLSLRKDLGRKLAGKDLYLITSLASLDKPDGFESPFIQSAEYLNMDYKGCFYYYSGLDEYALAENITKKDLFRKSIWDNEKGSL